MKVSQTEFFKGFFERPYVRKNQLFLHKKAVPKNPKNSFFEPPYVIKKCPQKNQENPVFRAFLCKKNVDFFERPYEEKELPHKKSENPVFRASPRSKNTTFFERPYVRKVILC